nr:hypothetical protein C01B4.4 - Caenorhabditis elegans [Caenorhabditis elegans]
MELLQLVSRSYWPTFYFICLCLHFTMYLNVNNKQSMPLLCDGFCKFIGPSFCFNSYVLLLVMITVTGFINLHALFYRTMCLKYFDSRKSNLETMKFTWHYLIPILVYILTYIPSQNHAEVYKETLSLHPTYQLEVYKVFGGFANSHHICMTINTLACATATLYVPIIGSYWKHVAMKILNSTISSSISSQTRIMLKTLIKGLTFQVILPLVCYVPVTFMYCWNKYSGKEIQVLMGFVPPKMFIQLFNTEFLILIHTPYLEPPKLFWQVFNMLHCEIRSFQTISSDQILISQYTLAFMGTLPCIFDPLLQMYFILPYRKTIQNFVACVSFRPNNAHAVSSIPRRSFLTPPL